MPAITIPAEHSRLSELFDFIGAAMRETGIPETDQNKINIAAEEIFVNIASYAYPDGMGEVAVDLSADPRRFTLEFRDGGIPYDPLAKEGPDTTLPAAEREIGGLGILMVKNLMDHVEYRYEDGKNVLLIRKTLC